MHDTRPIALMGETGIYFYEAILPNCWKGEINCLVGPFFGKEVAEYFVAYASNFGHGGSFSYRIFPKRDAWYVEIGTVEGSGMEKPLRPKDKRGY